MYTLKKSLGQHFLRDENICRKIVEALQQQPFERLLEVGPGGGALTKYLLELQGVAFRAVELDEEKVQYLETAYPALKGKLIHRSFLDIDCPFDDPFTLVGNFPYNISSQILFKVLEWEGKVERVVGMFQKEVAQRVAAPPGSKVYGVISVLIQAYFDVAYLFDVAPGCFNPPPKVMSGVIALQPRKTIPVMAGRKQFFLLVKTAFNQRRKTLRNAVKSLFPPEMLLDPVFQKRAEQLSVEEFAALTFKMNGNNG
ncbi:16S rRNA (adenine(1518)-N(6)/adenine(1519)-N(6))-dimethyltransferase RsmA [Flavihumibacter sp. CACIAM 22H1]|uniref:16S rRNA (adenine(1518)-N(6)/adenine(1519)-N(6))- dimethyltransferase RsmA n=1 Tax=Flavihumibacter sp. CACIAM 22H1 TaxID=1812911 RepID=UPI0007A8C788|nr:16S rRNA (adenine(1518)-N(6)/adenine(1519)-N(6))-dimethyltransferase RsmA [Flavihumibacter sp. CACIAM 22H1]KYP15595.1 MAG: 16S rRNA (adenine(1518)-N(6)/adenine(1519)-N(6))-dimethyltransferase [Flavihumibacter sp. CACIAM 22H1]